MVRLLHRSAAGLMALSLLAGTLVFGSEPAAAQCNQGTCAPGVWESSINLQNLSSNVATVSIDFYDKDGNTAVSYPITGGIPANGAISVFVPNQVAGLDPGQYSAVVNSTEQVKATVNTASTNAASAPWSAFGYEGADSTMSGTRLNFPGLYKSYYGFESEMVVQNVGSGDTTASVQFYNQSTGQAVGAAVSLGTIKASQARTFSLANQASLAGGNAGLYSAVVTSSGDVPITGIANIWRSGSPAGTASYNASTQGSSTLYAPALYKSYYGYASALTVQNIGTTNASVTVDYPSGEDATFTLAPNQARELYQPSNTSLPSGNTNGVFSARVTSTGGSLVGLVSLSQSGTGKGDFGSYNVPGTATSAVNIPNVLSDYYGYFSAVTVQNVCSEATKVTITYPGSLGSRTFPNASGSETIPANGTVNILHLNGSGDILPNSTTTSAVVTATNPDCNLVAVLQHNTSNGVNGYNAAKQPSDFLLALTGSPK